MRQTYINLLTVQPKLLVVNKNRRSKTCGGCSEYGNRCRIKANSDFMFDYFLHSEHISKEMILNLGNWVVVYIHLKLKLEDIHRNRTEFHSSSSQRNVTPKSKS